MLGRDFRANRPNQKWVCDITYIRTSQGWLYLAAVLDLFSRRVVGWSASRYIDVALVTDSLKMAFKRRSVPPGIIVHSDQGLQYCADLYQGTLRSLKAVCSMSRRGNCWDNAVAESFFATLKKELVHRKRFQTRGQARRELFYYIEAFYNRRRLHSTLGYLSPYDYEKAHNA